LSSEGLRLETDFKITPNNTYFLHTHWLEKGILKSPQVIAASQSDSDLYYNYRFVQEYGFEYAPPIEIAEGMDDEEVEQRYLERENLIEDSKNRMEEWIQRH